MVFYISVSEEEDATEDTVVELELKVKCTKNPNASKEATDPEELYLNSRGMYCLINYCKLTVQSL